MRHSALALALVVGLAAALLVSSRPHAAPELSTPGALVAVGGGGTPAAVVARALELAGGEAARVLVIPQASARTDAGVSTAEMWRAAGAGAVELLALDDPELARAAIGRADLLWMSGGDQQRLLEALEAAALVDAIRARHAAGAVVGGTSAGAAVLGRRALTGDAELERISAGTTVTVTGLDLWRGVLVDQHALARRRLNRTIAATLDHPELVGVAIDERTAAIVRGARLEVVGDSAVVVIDARGARVPELKDGEPSAATGVELHVLRAGMTLDLERR